MAYTSYRSLVRDYLDQAALSCWFDRGRRGGLRLVRTMTAKDGTLTASCQHSPLADPFDVCYKPVGSGNPQFENGVHPGRR
jgi:hypothetical protein